MKMHGKAGLASGIGVGLVLFFCVVRTPSHADELLLVPPELRPTNGLFYSFQHPDHPPLPQNIFPELPLEIFLFALSALIVLSFVLK